MLGDGSSLACLRCSARKQPMFSEPPNHSCIPHTNGSSDSSLTPLLPSQVDRNTWPSCSLLSLEVQTLFLLFQTCQLHQRLPCQPLCSKPLTGAHVWTWPMETWKEHWVHCYLCLQATSSHSAFLDFTLLRNKAGILMASSTGSRS